MTESDLIIENIINKIEGRTLTEMAQWRSSDDFLTGWITPAEANDFIKDAIASGEYHRGEIKKSSMRWADKTDHSKGYLCRVVLAGDKASPKRAYSTRTMKRKGLNTKSFKSKSGKVYQPEDIFRMSFMHSDGDSDSWGNRWDPFDKEAMKFIVKNTNRPILYNHGVWNTPKPISVEEGIRIIDKGGYLDFNTYKDKVVIQIAADCDMW